MKYYLAALLLFFIAGNSHSSTIDGGVFTEDRAKGEVRDLGGKAAEALPSERFPVTDREINGPAGSSFFVLTKENKCFYASFKVLGDKKQLVVFRDSRVALENCIYQSRFSSYPSGFSLVEEDGGICKPSYAESIEELRYFQKLKLISNVVSINYCLKNTMSYGLIVENKKLFKKIAKKEKIIQEQIPEPPKEETVQIPESNRPKAEVVKAQEPQPKEPKTEELKVSEQKKEIPDKVVAQVEVKQEKVKKIEPTRKAEKKQNSKKEKLLQKSKPAKKEKTIIATAPTPIETLRDKISEETVEQTMTNAKEESLYQKVKTTVLTYVEKVKQRGLAAVKKEEPISAAEVQKDSPSLPEEKAEVIQKTSEEMTVSTKKVTKPKLKSKAEDRAYSIQIAAHDTQKDADMQSEGLLKQGHESFVQEAMVNGKKWYRVMVGKFDSKAQAEKYRSEKLTKNSIVKKLQ